MITLFIILLPDLYARRALVGAAQAKLLITHVLLPLHKVQNRLQAQLASMDILLNSIGSPAGENLRDFES
jgi:hypothetical protein